MRILTWFIATLFVVYTFTLGTAASVFSDAIQCSLHLSPAEVSLSFGLFVIGFACMQLPAGFLLDRYSARYVLSAAITIMIIANIIASMATSGILFGVANFLEGMAGSFDFICASVLVAQWFSPRMFPILTGLTQTLACLGVALIHYSLTLDLESHTWQGIYRHFVITGIILLILSLLFVKTPTDYHQEFKLTFGQALKRVLRKKQNWLCSLGAGTSFGLLLSYASFWYAEINKHYAVSTLNNAIIGGCIFLGIGIGTPLLGYLSNIFHSRKMILHVSLSCGIMLLMLGLYLPHFNTTSLLPSKIIAFGIGFFLSGGLLYYTVVSESTDHDTRGLALSMTNTATFLFNTLSLMIPYLFLTQVSQSYFTYLWIYPGCAILTLIFNYFIKETAT